MIVRAKSGRRGCTVKLCTETMFPTLVQMKRKEISKKAAVAMAVPSCSAQSQKRYIFHWWDAIKICCSWRQLIALQVLLLLLLRCLSLYPCSQLFGQLYTLLEESAFCNLNGHTIVAKCARFVVEANSKLLARFACNSKISQWLVRWVGTFLSPYPKIAPTTTTTTTTE